MAEHGVGECSVMAEVEGAGGPTLPEDHCCANCGYPSGKSGSVVCPECGWEATTREMNIRASRLATIEAWERGSRWYGWWLKACVVYAFGALVVSRSLMAGIGAVFAVGVAVPISAALGHFSFRVRDEERQRYLVVVWEQTLWILHLPWLVAPVFVTVALFVGLIDRWAGDTEARAYQVVVTVGFFAWLVGCLVAFLVWWRRRLRALALDGYRRLGWADGWAFVAGVAVTLGTGFIGFGAGVTAAFGVAEWVGLGR